MKVTTPRMNATPRVLTMEEAQRALRNMMAGSVGSAFGAPKGVQSSMRKAQTGRLHIVKASR